MIKLKLLKYFSVFIILMCSCSAEKKNFEFKKWISEKELMETKAVDFQGDCDSLASLLKDLKDEEFRAQIFLLLAECYEQKGDEKNAEKYLKKYLSAGKHISWIDTTKFSSILPSVTEFKQLQEKFWKKKDTFHFSEIERRVSLDQAYVKENTLREKIFVRNSKYLLNITDSIGFPWQPGPNNFEKERFRVGVKPDLLAIHAPIEDKIIHQQNAIEGARKGEVSWRVPLSIGVTFFTQRSREDVMPLRFLHFDSLNRLNVEDSYLQLYSVKKYLQDNNLSRMKLQPSLKNSQEEKIILSQLQDLKKAMVEELGWLEKAIEISTDPNVAENVEEDQQRGTYSYTFSVF